MILLCCSIHIAYDDAMMKKGKIFIGTSGWHYKHWKAGFYPPKLKNEDQLNFYSKHFSSTEINNSFYRLPTMELYENWYSQVPADFIFAVKGSRFITHLKKLNVDRSVMDQFIQRASHLKKKLGPILFQLPPKWKVNLERLDHFLNLLPTDHRFAFEFRDHTWNIAEVYRLLERHNCAYCQYDLAGYQSPQRVTADFVYIRLHGPGDKYEGSYHLEKLEVWADCCKSYQNEGKDIYLYFDNDQKAYATQNGQKLSSLLK